ncbi:hypothetical protein DPMN_166417 [Dreissena polymorpha]|uniref:Uncharacterized protein n=1 Tax=Dreissena polymorpha TaxID=45954 RepID=A0A9D4EYT5_DREPO|nr:hypothetical protein DPMN_166417 [Dreissena polymorpha]
MGSGSGEGNYMTICEIVIYRQADCPLGSYSVYCSKQCHCRVGPCDSVTGYCGNGVCEDGWKGIACNETCIQGSFGLNCSSPCRCLTGANCNHIYGHCPNDQCAPGWITSNCSIGKIDNCLLVSAK